MEDLDLEFDEDTHDFSHCENDCEECDNECLYRRYDD